MPNICWQRLKQRADFQNISKKGQAIKTPAFVFLYTFTSAPQSRIGFTATRRTIGGAVLRNKAKRRMRALADATMRLNEGFALPEGCAAIDGTFVARKYILDRDLERMCQEFKHTLAKKGFGCG